MRFLFLEPFYGGSHREFADGLVRHSRHRIDLVTLPARFWKWRMRGAALHFIHSVKNLASYDGVIASSLLSLSDLKALAGPACPPVLVYFHENQLTYPLAPGERIDFQYGFTDITTALAADRILFNSRSHLAAFLDHLPRFIGRMPEYRPFWVVETIAAKAAVLPPGCDFDTVAQTVSAPDPHPPLIIWNHRWEFDKNPEEFFAALEKVRRKGIDFRLAVLGERFQRAPAIFETARESLASKIVQWGGLSSRRAYYDCLARGAIVVSTAIQENFGLAVVEAIRMGCLPLLPFRLCYPEIIPPEFHPLFLYPDGAGLVERLASLLTTYTEYAPIRAALSQTMETYCWAHLIAAYDAELDLLGGRAVAKV